MDLSILEYRRTLSRCLIYRSWCVDVSILECRIIFSRCLIFIDHGVVDLSTLECRGTLSRCLIFAIFMVGIYSMHRREEEQLSKVWFPLYPTQSMNISLSNSSVSHHLQILNPSKKIDLCSICSSFDEPNALDG